MTADTRRNAGREARPSVIDRVFDPWVARRIEITRRRLHPEIAYSSQPNAAPHPGRPPTVLTDAAEGSRRDDPHLRGVPGDLSNTEPITVARLSRPTTSEADLGQALVNATERGLERGDVLEPLPDRPLLPEAIEQWEDESGVVAAFPVMSGSPDQAETERFGMATVAGAYVIEFFPNEGWIVVRASPAGAKSDGELRDELLDLVGEWQATITELVLERFPDREAHSEALFREIGRGP